MKISELMTHTKCLYFGDGHVAQWIKSLLMLSASPIRVLAQVPATLFLIQPLANVPEKQPMMAQAVELLPHVHKSQMELKAPAFSLAQLFGDEPTDTHNLGAQSSFTPAVGVNCAF